MKLTLQTELGGFDFQLSRASIIYLLGVAQQLEDEGDPKFNINKNIDNINREADNKPVFHDVKTEDVIEPVKAKTKILIAGDTREDILETAKKMPEELFFPPAETERAPEEAESAEEDFEKMLDEFEQKQKEKTAPPPYYAGTADGKYKGFMYIKCEHCGETRGFCAKQPIDEYRCNECGGKTKLKDLRRMFLDCECGSHYKYYTNETAEVVTNNCINCGSPVDMMLNSRRTAYVSIGGGYCEKKETPISGFPHRNSDGRRAA